jgi:hypothetical protein
VSLQKRIQNPFLHGLYPNRFANGTRIGEYAVVQPDGKKRTVTYVADDAGFRPKVSYVAATPDELLGRLKLPKSLIIPSELFQQKPLAVNSVDFVLDFRQNQKKIVVARLVPKKSSTAPVSNEENEVLDFSPRSGDLFITTTEISVFPTSARSQRRVNGQRTFRDPVGKILKFSEPIATSPEPLRQNFVRQNFNNDVQDLESLRLNQLRRQELGRLQALQNVQAQEKQRTDSNSVLNQQQGNGFAGVRGGNGEQVSNEVGGKSDRKEFQRAINVVSPAQPAFGQRLIARRPFTRSGVQQQAPAPIIPVAIFT